LRIAIISDTHELHRDVDLPKVDLLIHAGDWTFFSKKMNAVDDFNAWLTEQHIRHGVVLVPGNHEFYLEVDSSLRSLTDNATVLIGERLSMQGLNIWGSPVTPLSGVAFGISDPKERARYYAQIPDDTHILITHGPPYGILDGPPGTNQHRGCPELLNAVKRIKPLLHIFGHVHTGYGIHETTNTTFVNAALLGPDGDIANKPILLNLPEIER
jgi:Icc-related predicted phosphoesterase